jgi:hypothetical protein
LFISDIAIEDIKASYDDQVLANMSPEEMCVVIAEHVAIDVYTQLRRAAAASRAVRTRVLDDVLKSLTQPLESSVRDTILPNRASKCPVYYYHLVADYFACRAGESEDVLSCFRSILGHPMVPPLFAMLFYRHLTASMSTSRCLVFLNGAHRLFQIDLERQTRIFEPIYSFLKNDVVVNIKAASMSRIAWSARRDLIALVCRVFFHYEDQPHRCLIFVNDLSAILAAKFPSEDTPPNIPTSLSFVNMDSYLVHETHEEDVRSHPPSPSPSPSMSPSQLQAQASTSSASASGKKSARDAATPHIASATYIEDKGTIPYSDDETGAHHADDVQKRSAAAGTRHEVDHMDSDSDSEQRKTTHELNAAELFVRESMLQLHDLRSEAAASRYLRGLSFTKSLSVSEATRVRLRNALYALTIPGDGPASSRALRQQARNTMDTLFPEGWLPRMLINAGFRVFHTLTWPKSVFLWSCAKAGSVRDAVRFALHSII